MTTDLHLTADQETELIAAFTAWWELWTVAGNSYGAERIEADNRAAALFNAQVARGGAYRDAWITMQDALSVWWELPEKVREWVRDLPAESATVAARALVVVAA